jgi:hypothetical protein
MEDEKLERWGPAVVRGSPTKLGKLERRAETTGETAKTVPLKFKAEWTHQKDRASYDRSRRIFRLILWWSVLNFFGIVRTCLTVIVMLAAPFVMQAAMKNPTFWIGLVFSARARQIRSMVFRIAAAIHYTCLFLVARRMVHYMMAALVVPGSWLLGDAAAKEPWWMAGSLKAFRRSLLERCTDGRRWMTHELQGQEILLTTADGATVSAILLRPSGFPDRSADAARRSGSGLSLTRGSGSGDTPRHIDDALPSSAPLSASPRRPPDRTGPLSVRNSDEGKDSETAFSGRPCGRQRVDEALWQMPTVVRFNGNSEAW